MFAKTVFSGFSVDNLANARAFYTETLELQVKDEGARLRLNLPGGAEVFVYEKGNHEPATFTILNFEVENIDDAADLLRSRGVQFEHYPDMPLDEKGILRRIPLNLGPDIAWFKDPAGNILSILQSEQ